jgi:ferritin-like metal-binding protein YciE
MLERIKTPQDLYHFELGSALSMERKALNLLDDSAEEARDPALEQLLREHREETRQQVGRVEQAFSQMGWDVDDSPCLPMEALEKESQVKLKLTEEQLRDAVICSGAAETEHHEIAVYESLIAEARALGRDDVAATLQQNLRQEQHALQRVQDMSSRVVGQMPQRQV